MLENIAKKKEMCQDMFSDVYVKAPLSWKVKLVELYTMEDKVFHVFLQGNDHTLKINVNKINEQQTDGNHLAGVHASKRRFVKPHSIV